MTQTTLTIDLNESDFHLLPNNTAVKEPCSICGAWDRAPTPYAVVCTKDPVSGFVCDQCLREHAPLLFEVVNGHCLSQVYERETKRLGLVLDEVDGLVVIDEREKCRDG